MKSETAANIPKKIMRLILVSVSLQTTRRSHLNLMAPAWVSQRLINQRSQQHATQLRGCRYSGSRASQGWGGRGTYRPSLDIYRGGSTTRPLRTPTRHVMLHRASARHPDRDCGSCRFLPRDRRAAVQFSVWVVECVPRRCWLHHRRHIARDAPAALAGLSHSIAALVLRSSSMFPDAACCLNSSSVSWV